jgi:hypothetical protein
LPDMGTLQNIGPHGGCRWSREPFTLWPSRRFRHRPLQGEASIPFDWLRFQIVPSLTALPLEGVYAQS